MSESTYIAFAGARAAARGTPAHVLPVLKRRFDRDRSDLVLVFEEETGRQVDFDLRGELQSVLARAAPPQERGPGRPKLGVVSREVTLLPRHWLWLEQQPSGASAALRAVVEGASKSAPDRERARKVRFALGRVLTAVAGDRPHYEEASRALYAGDAARFREHVRRWPKDIRAYALERFDACAAAEAAAAPDPAETAKVVRELYQTVWSEGDLGAVARLVAPRYEIVSDPGDPWDGKTLDHDAYKERVRASRGAFPDLRFRIDELVVAGDRAAVCWCAEGTHSGDLKQVRATGRRLSFSGQTMYIIAARRVAGHRQTVDRLGFVQQLR